MPREEIYQNGQLVKVEDTRTLAEAIEERKQVWADETTKLIRTKVTETDGCYHDPQRRHKQFAIVYFSLKQKHLSL